MAYAGLRVKELVFVSYGVSNLWKGMMTYTVNVTGFRKPTILSQLTLREIPI